MREVELVCTLNISIKVVPVPKRNIVKTYGLSGGLTPGILILGTIAYSDYWSASSSVLRGRNPPYLFLTGTCVDLETGKEYELVLAGIEPLSSS
jgi:hypothetical protein